MSSRLEMIKRLAETDGYWAAYLDGMNDAHHVGEVAAQSADFAEHARLIEARLARNSHRASFMSDKISMDEAREKARLDRDRQDPTDEQLDAYIASVRAAGIPVHEVPRTMAREDYDQEWARVPNAADLGGPRIP